MTKATHMSSQERLRSSGLRPDAPARCACRSDLSQGATGHLTVEELHEEAVTAGVPVSLATVYNTLTSSPSRMIRVLAVESARTYFDTNVS